MKTKSYIIAFTVATALTVIAASAYAANPVVRQHHAKNTHSKYVADPLGRDHWTYGKRARMQKQMMQAEYHEKQVERAEAAQRKAEKEEHLKHIDE